jgi:hypothetical protein
MLKSMSLSSRRELIHSVGHRYAGAGRKDKGRILDEFVAATGYHRKYAIAILGFSDANRTPARRESPRRKRIYDEDVKQLLVVIWQAAMSVNTRVFRKRVRQLSVAEVLH